MPDAVQPSSAADDAPALQSLRRARVSALVAYLPHAALLGAVCALSFLSGGYVLVRMTPVVLALAVAFGVWAWLGPRRRPGVAYTVGLAGLALYALWTAVSIAWSIGPDLSWVGADYALFYVIVAVVVGSAPAGPGQARLAGYGYVAVAVPVAVYAFLGKVLPDRVDHAHVYARLSDPLGYWNVLAMMMVFALPLGIEAAARRGMPVALRGLAAGASVLFGLTLVFAFSRGGSLALIVALIVYFLLANERLTSFVSLLIVGLPVVAVVYRERGLDTLFVSTTDDALRTAQGHAFGRWALVAIGLAIVAQVAVALVHRRLRLGPVPRRVIGTVVLIATLVGVGVGAQMYMDRYGGPREFARSIADQFRGDDGAGSGVDDGSIESGNSVGRLLSTSSNGRIPIWRDALQQYESHPLTGTGAGTYRFSNYLFRDRPDFVVKHAHNQWVNALSELGLVGAGLFAVAIGGLVVAALWPAGRRGRGRDRGLLAALQAGVVAFAFHLTVDWDWDMAAATVTFLLFAGVCAAWQRGGRGDVALGGTAGGDGAGEGRADDDVVVPAAGPAAGRRRVAPAAFLTGVLALMAVSWILPCLSERAAIEASSLGGQGKVAEAIAAAERSHRLDPLAVDSLITLALLQQQEGRSRDALDTLDEAARLQPQNYRVHFQLGLLYLNVLGQKREAEDAFRRALALNPFDEESAVQLRVAEQR